MGFNKRFVSGKGIAAAYVRNGINGVIDYFVKPDALIGPSGTSWAVAVHRAFDKAWNDDTPTQENKDFIKVVEEGVDTMSSLEVNAYTLKETLATETDPELHAYIQANIENIDKKLNYYYV